MLIGYFIAAEGKQLGERITFIALVLGGELVLLNLPIGIGGHGLAGDAESIGEAIATLRSRAPEAFGLTALVAAFVVGFMFLNRALDRRNARLEASRQPDAGSTPAPRPAVGTLSLVDEDADLRTHLAALGPEARAELFRVLEAPEEYRREILKQLSSRPGYADLATVIAMAETDEVVRLRLRRAIRDLGA